MSKWRRAHRVHRRERKARFQAVSETLESRVLLAGWAGHINIDLHAEYVGDGVAPMEYLAKIKVSDGGSTDAVRMRTPKGRWISLNSVSGEWNQWESSRSYPNLAAFNAEFGDGPALLEVHSPASGTQTVAFTTFQPKTTKMLPWPSRRPINVRPTHGLANNATSVNFTWQSAGTAGPESLQLEVYDAAENEMVSETLASSRTSFGPVQVAAGKWYGLYVDFANQFRTTAAEGVTLSVTKENEVCIVFGTASVPAGLADLVASSIVAPTQTLLGGDAVVATLTGGNIGNRAAVATVDRPVSASFVLSRNKVLGDADDVLLGTRPTEGFFPGAQFKTAMDWYSVPRGAAPGYYYMAVAFDSSGVVTESNENNNVAWTATPTIRVVSTRLRPDLSWKSLSATPGAVLAGGVLTATRSFQVADSFISDDFNIQYRLSTDRVWGNGDDVVIARSELINRSADWSEGIHSGRFSLAVPAQTHPGAYYLLAKLDGSNGVTESNEANNVIVGSPIQVLAYGNDAFAYRTTITGSSATVTGTNLLGTKEAREPLHGGQAGGHSSWWTWTAPYTGRAEIDTLGSGFDTLLGVYRGTSVSTLIPVASNNDLSATSTASRVSFAAARGQTYQIAVDGHGGTTGSITLNVRLTAGVLDNLQAVVVPSSGWKPINNGYQGKQVYAAPGSGTSTATWTFGNLLAGTYRVSVTWGALATAAGNAPFSIYDGSKPLGTVSVNQKVAPKGTSFDSVIWQSLGSFKLTGSSLIIKLANKANGYVLADAVRIEKIG